MADIDKVAAQAVASLAQTVSSARTKVVADAFQLLIPKEEEYIESDVEIEKLEFASYAVGGLAAAATTPPQNEVRASSKVTIPLSDSANGHAVAEQTIVLYGPGDVSGLDPAQIVRRYPAPGTRNAEVSVLAHIEFDRPEMPWAFSAATAKEPLRPWLTLIVVEKASARWVPVTNELPLLQVPLAELPLGPVHQWAHAQVTQSATVPLSTRLSPAYAKVNLSRLVSPRVLKEETEYIAAVVPTTDVGVHAGRGVSGGTLGPAWTAASSDPVLLPVFDWWEFRTGEDGDFATLALRLKGVEAPYEVGRRFIDASEPGAPLTSLGPDDDGRKQVLRCALYSTTPPPPDREGADAAVWAEAKIDELREQLELPAKLEADQAAAGGVDPIPVLGPRIYAKLQRGAAALSGDDWFTELNLSPMHRIVAGLGTRVIQHDQEQLMQAAWAQLGDVQRANRAIALAQLAELVATRLHARLSALEPSRLLQVAAPVATRVSFTPGATVAASIGASATPTAVLAGAFRRTVRPDGPIVRRAAVATRERAGRLAGDGVRLRDFTREYVNPDGVTGLSASAIAQLDVKAVAEALGVPRQSVADTLTRAVGELGGGVYARLADKSTWQAPAAGFDPSALTADRWAKALLDEPGDAAIRKVREQRIAPIIAELALAPHTEGLELRTKLEKRATTLNNALMTRLRDAAPGTGIGGGVAIIHGRAIGELAGAGLAGRVARGAVGGIRVTPHALGGRRPTGIRGLNTLDVSALSRVTRNTPAAERRAAFTALAELGARRVTPVLDRISAVSVDTLRDAMSALLDPAGVFDIPIVPRRDTVAVDALPALIDPRITIRASLRGRLSLTAELAAKVFLPERVRRVMAGPVFTRPMYQALADYDRDWLLPGLQLLPATDFVTVLSTNSAFTEAFLVGLSDEFGRELLWRQFPTDAAGTYFARFWDAEQDELTSPIHRFASMKLGEHVSIGGDGGSEPRAVIVVKSDLVRRYPDIIIQAVKAHGPADAPQFDGPESEVARQLFATYLEPDVALVGVDRTVTELNTPEWWITIAEHPTATRFHRGGGVDGRGFAHMAAGDSGADFAKAHLHDPVRVAFHAVDLIETED